jgi:CelD/BcsL family acetyltransferase involved in cellulose biosynthesis
MYAELITDHDGLEQIEDGWRALAELRGNAFVTPEWFRAWSANQGRFSEPLVAAVRRSDGSLAGVLPLVLDSTRRPRSVRFAGATLGDRFHPAAAEDDEAEVAAAAMGALAEAGFDRYMVMLECVDADRDWWRRMQREPTARRAVVTQQCSEMLYAELTGLDWDAYFAERGKWLRRKVRRGIRRLQDEHRMRVRRASAQTLDTDLDELFRLHALRFGDGSSLKGPGARRTLRAFAAAAQRRGWLRLDLMEADDEVVAAKLAWRLGGCFAIYQGGFDPAWQSFNVGTVLEAMTIRSAIDEGARQYDFLLGEEEYKLRFSNSSRQVHTALITPAQRPIRLLAVGEAGARRVGTGLAEVPAVGRAARSLRGLLPTNREA